MGFFKRLFGICATRPPGDPGCFGTREGRIVVDLARAPELSDRGGALRLEGSGLPERVLVFRGEDDAYHAFVNKCAHGGRRLDPLPGTSQVQCCSVGKSTYDYEGMRISGAASGDVRVLEVEVDGDTLVISVT